MNARESLDFKTDTAALSVPEAARYLAVGEGSIWKAIRESKLPARKLGARTLILRADADSFLTNLPQIGAAA